MSASHTTTESLHYTNQPISSQKPLPMPELEPISAESSIYLKHKYDRNRQKYTWGYPLSLKHRHRGEPVRMDFKFPPTSVRLLLKAAAGDKVFRMA